ncbi:hypothetical protein GCM10008927_10310 [Amylibacter ulvae]|uniref:Asparaginase n=1 Tax=Paramylibacter ulvae TaxID=1651968 RepID=A0ABQ3CYL8_9RHOB|nr:asparaginase [Amylibacter ulvae]GHA47437.1 hypothetical protein GCM10008927_10310 [Amylibacter ulvae]
MAKYVDLIEVWRGEFLECVHRGHAVVCDHNGDVIAQWGDSSDIILPRSSCKMLQALPLIESGAAEKFGLNPSQLALSCASHQGAKIHVNAVETWLGEIGLAEQDLRCGPQCTADLEYRSEMIRAGDKPDQRHNNCSGKHSGFLTLNKHLSGGSEYIEIDHPVQKAIVEATEAMAGENISGHVIDGCSAPNLAISLRGLAMAMARMGTPTSDMGVARGNAARALTAAMAEYPELVAGEGRACTELMRAMNDGTVVKTGAEGVFTAILPERGLGVALKIADGATRASEAAMAALLVRLGVADENHPMVQKRLKPADKNRRDIVTGHIRPADMFFENGASI